MEMKPPEHKKRKDSEAKDCGEPSEAERIDARRQQGTQLPELKKVRYSEARAAVSRSQPSVLTRGGGEG